MKNQAGNANVHDNDKIQCQHIKKKGRNTSFKAGGHRISSSVGVSMVAQNVTPRRVVYFSTEINRRPMDNGHIYNKQKTIEWQKTPTSL